MFRTSGLKFALCGTSVAALLASGAAMAQAAANDSNASQGQAEEIDRIVVAQAQTQAQGQTQGAQQAGDEEDLAVEEIVITGSRIRRKTFADAPQPTLVLDGEFLAERGYTNIADGLNQLPGFGVGIDGVGNSQQNVGQEFVDIADLGAQRTLTLVNGRRFVTGNAPATDPNGRVNGLSVDLNNIPTALIERTETVLVGGAPIYGSDAIAGTVTLAYPVDADTH